MNITLYKVAGTSNLNGVSKARFANNLDVRIKTLVKGGHTAIELIELPEPMSKQDAIAYLTANPGSVDVIALGNKATSFETKAKREAVKGTKTPKAAKTEKPAKTEKAPAKTKVTKTAVKARSKKAAPAEAAVEDNAAVEAAA